MEYTFNKNQLLLNSEISSVGPGLYRLNEAQKNNTIALPWDNLTTNINLSSTYLEKECRVDLDSNLKNLSSPLSNSFENKHIPSEKPLPKEVNLFNDVNKAFFYSQNSRLNEPAFELKGMAKNRFISLKKNPQDNAVEPFGRIGSDTYQDLVDNFKECKETPKNVDTCQNGKGYEYHPGNEILTNACGINKIPETPKQVPKNDTGLLDNLKNLF